MQNFTPSLLKYSTPFQISIGKNNLNSTKKKINDYEKNEFYPLKESTIDNRVDIWNWIQDMENENTIEEILNNIIKPREIYLEDKGQIWIQTCLSVPATRTEVIQLENELNKRLKQKQANETGICPIREDLYSQCFDEIIRQVIINFKKRGLLLSCVRDQIKMTIDTYKSLYESSIAFGIRKVINSDKFKNKRKKQIEELDFDCKKLEQEIKILEEKIENTKKEQERKKKSDLDNHNNKIAELNSEKNKKIEELEIQLVGDIKSK